MHSLYFTLLTLLVSCGSVEKKPEPAWVHQSTRNVDNGYIEYVGRSESVTLERTQFQAEGLALEDLANECSLVPKGTRIEDRFTDKTPNGYLAYVKVAVEMQECDRASKSTDPLEIKKIANLPFTEQLKKYQDLMETGANPEIAGNQGGVEVEPATEVSPPPERGQMNDSVHFYVTRQYVAYQKEIVILSPPTAYQPQSPESHAFTTAVAPVQTQLQTSAASQPTLKTNPQPWSTIANASHPEVRIGRPANLSARSAPVMRQAMRPNPASGGVNHPQPRASNLNTNAQPRPGPSPYRRRKKRY